MSQPTLFLMLGYPGAGKTTTAKTIEQLTKATHLWADQVRREMYQQPTYSQAENTHLYTHLNDVAAEQLEQGHSVIFDTGFNYYKDRQRLREIGDRSKAKTLIVWVKSPKATARQRAVEDAHLHSHTRVLGHMEAEHFDRLSDALEEPRQDEAYIAIDGTKDKLEDIRQQLQDAQVL